MEEAKNTKKAGKNPQWPNYLHMSKAAVVEAERERIEKEAKVKAYAKSLNETSDNPDSGVDAPPLPDKPEKKGKGRPKKIDGQRPGEKVD